jgi:hypothetical protein
LADTGDALYEDIHITASCGFGMNLDLNIE